LPIDACGCVKGGKQMETVSFTSMAEGTKEDYEILARYEE
jgi:hypothetical protein